jgi:hypothetical protein
MVQSVPAARSFARYETGEVGETGADEMDDPVANRGRGIIFFYVGVAALIACPLVCVAYVICFRGNWQENIFWAIIYGPTALWFLGNVVAERIGRTKAERSRKE